MDNTYVRGCRLLPGGGDYYCGAPEGEYAVCKRQVFSQRFAFQCPYVLVRASRLLWWTTLRTTLPRVERAGWRKRPSVFTGTR